MTVSTFSATPTERVLVATPATLSAVFLDQYGEPRNPGGTVTVDIVDANGTAVVTDATTTYDSTTGAYTTAINASHIPSTALLTASWSNGALSTSDTVQTVVEVVGGYYFSIAQARAYKTGDLNDLTKYSTPLLRQVRAEVEATFERVCWPFVPRYRRVEVQGHGKPWVILPDMHVRTVRSVREYSTDGTYVAFTASELGGVQVDDSGIIRSIDGRPFGWGCSRVVVEYTAGFDRPPPDVLDAALYYLRYRANTQRNGLPERATSYSAGPDGGTYSLTTAGLRGSITGLPDVDVVLNDKRYRRTEPGIG